jgi:hypothetical protein
MVIELTLGVIAISRLFSFPPIVWIQLRVFVWLYGFVIGLRMFDARICRRWCHPNSDYYVSTIICIFFSLGLALDSQMWVLSLPLLIIGFVVLFTAEVQYPVKSPRKYQNIQPMVTYQKGTTVQRKSRPRSSPSVSRAEQYVSTQPSQRAFVLYSDKDVFYASELRVQFQSVERQGSIDFWDTTKIPAGEIRQVQIERAIASSGVAVVLVSQHLLASDFAQYQLSQILGRAMTGGTVVFLLHVKSCFYQLYGLDRFEPINPPSKPLATLPTPEARNKVYVDLVKKTCQRLGMSI